MALGSSGGHHVALGPRRTLLRLAVWLGVTEVRFVASVGTVAVAIAHFAQKQAGFTIPAQEFAHLGLANVL